MGIVEKSDSFSHYQELFDDKKQEEMRSFFREFLGPKGILETYDRNSLIDFSKHRDFFGIIMSGIVSVNLTSFRGRGKQLYFLRSGEIFGEMELIDSGSLSYSLRTKERSVISCVNRATVEKKLESRPELYRYFIHSITRKFRIVTLQLANNVFNDAKGRVAEALIRLSACSDPLDIDMTEGMITTALTQSELAYNIGCSRITITRILRSFFDEGLIKRVKRKITIVDLEGLSQYTDKVQ